MKPSPIGFILVTALLVSVTIILLTHHHARKFPDDPHHFYIEK